MKKQIHNNSLVALSIIRRKSRGERCQKILAYIKKHPRNTDRKIMSGMRFTEPNQVRPRITDLLKAGLIRECGNVKDHLTGIMVRTVEAV